MFTLKGKNALEKEWNSVQEKERKIIEKKNSDKEPYINKVLEDKVPEKLKKTLDSAFQKAFEVVFDKGMPIIEKTYNKEKRIIRYEENEKKHEIKDNSRTLKAFSKNSSSSNRKNKLLTGIEGVGLGALGIGLPDIPIFTGVILKSMYEIAMSYGYEYESLKEKFFILKLIEVAMINGEEFEKYDREINNFIEDMYEYDIEVYEEHIKRQILITSNEISNEMLYMKFIQGLPVIGIAGGFKNTEYLHKITEYADLKYKRRFLYDKIKGENK